MNIQYICPVDILGEDHQKSIAITSNLVLDFLNFQTRNRMSLYFLQFYYKIINFVFFVLYFLSLKILFITNTAFFPLLFLLIIQSLMMIILHLNVLLHM